MLKKRKSSQNQPSKKLDLIIFYLLFILGISATLWMSIWWMSPNHVPQNFSGYLHILDYILFLLLTYSLGYSILYEVLSWTIFRTIKTPKKKLPAKGSRVAFLTAFVPGTEPYSILEKTLSAMVGNTYPHDTWVLDEGNDPAVKRICKKLGVKHYSRKGIEEFNQVSGQFKAKTKGGNYNSWFKTHGHKYDFVAQLDVDFIPKKSFLTKTLGYFKDPNVAFVGTPQVYGNQQENWISQGAAEQTYGFYGPIQRGLYGKDMALFIGANHVIRVAAHDDIEGYAGHITEDHLTGMKYYAKRWKSVYVPEILAIGEGPTTWESYFNQQMRWAYGSIDILFREGYKHFGKGKMRIKHFLHFILLEHFYFYGVAQAVGLFLLVLYFLFGINSVNISSDSLVTYYLPSVLIQILFFFWIQKFYINPKKEFGIGVRGKLLTIASWPIFLVAFLGAITKKRLTYKVTPKGDQSNTSINLSMFIPHFVVGTISLVCVVIAPLLNREAIVLLIFATLNTIFMYFFVGLATLEKLKEFNFIPTFKLVQEMPLFFQKKD